MNPTVSARSCRDHFQTKQITNIRIKQKVLKSAQGRSTIQAYLDNVALCVDARGMTRKAQTGELGMLCKAERIPKTCQTFGGLTKIIRLFQESWPLSRPPKVEAPWSLLWSAAIVAFAGQSASAMAWPRLGNEPGRTKADPVLV